MWDEAPRNQVFCMDALELLKRLPAESLSAIWASPPYNLADPFRGGSPRTKERSRPQYTYGPQHGGKGDGCCQPEPEYQREQTAILQEWYRALHPDGVAFYSHKVRIKDGRAISPLEWLYRTPLVLLQEVVWDRGGSPNVDPIRFLPVSERVYVLTKRPGVRLHNPWRLPDVLRFPPTHHKRAVSGHPCPTHPGLVRACLSVVPKPPDGRRLLVCDPYLGTGTTAIVARQLGMDYLGGEVSAAYCALARRNLDAACGQTELFVQDALAAREAVG